MVDLLPVILFLFLFHTTNACNILAFGAKCDGMTDDTSALQSALNACSKNRTRVVVPNASSACLCQPLKLPSHTFLFLQPGAILKAGVKWNTSTSFLTAGAVNNITISGYKATIDGSGEQVRFERSFLILFF
jgi:polygalacturonase